MIQKINTIIFILMMSTSIYAGNVDTFGIGSKATAMAGAYSAYADDPYAAHYNPAGLSQIKKTTISLGVEFLDPDLHLMDYTAFDYSGRQVSDSVDFTDKSDILPVPHIGIAIPINNKLTFGLAAYVPWGLHVKWDDEPKNNPAAYVAAESYYIRKVVAPSLAYEINDKWSVGFGVLLGQTTTGEKRRLYAPGLPFHNKLIKVNLEDSFNISANAGILYKPTDKLAIGLTYRSKTEVDMDGDAKVENWNGPGKKVNANGVQIDHPDQIQLGVRYTPINQINLEMDLVYTRWNMIKEYYVEFSPQLLGSSTGIRHRRNWKNTMQLRLGVEWKINPMFALRGGYFYDPSPIRDESFDTMWPDADRKTYSLGLGINFNEHWVLDLLVQYSYAEYKREIGGESHNLNEAYGNIADHSSGKARVSTNANGSLLGYGATLTYKF